MVESGITGALIIEDDTQLIPKFKERLLNLMTRLPEKWDVIKISMKDNLELNQEVSIDEHVFIIGENNSSAAYLVSLDGAKKLLSATKQLFAPMRDMLNRSTLKYAGVAKFHTFVIEPALAIDTTQSTTQSST